MLGSLVDNYKSEDELSETEDQAYVNFMKEIEQTDNTNNEEINKESGRITLKSYVNLIYLQKI